MFKKFFLKKLLNSGLFSMQYLQSFVSIRRLILPKAIILFLAVIFSIKLVSSKISRPSDAVIQKNHHHHYYHQRPLPLINENSSVFYNANPLIMFNNGASFNSNHSGLRVKKFRNLVFEKDWLSNDKNKNSKQEQRQQAKYRLAKKNTQNISHLLDQLLYGYDSHLRPDFGGPPIEILIDFHIRSMGPISEVDMTYVIDCYFRQTWTDERLAYKSILESFDLSKLEMDPYNIKGQNKNRSNQKALALSIYMLDRIWKPQTYFLNSRESQIHTITLPNKFVRIYSNGRVLYSSRMTIKANCQMNLENFPMDTQRCPLQLSSFGYTSKDVIYYWNPTLTVVINPDMKMSQFDLIGVPVSSFNKSINTASIQNIYSVLVATFHFKRHMGSFVIEVYAPCIMLVVLSWFGFYINREATGLTTVLTMTFLGLELRNDLPKVPYLTALDYFVYISFAFISATILEFGFVHFFTKIGSGEFYFMPIQVTSQSENIENNHFDTSAISSQDDDSDSYEISQNFFHMPSSRSVECLNNQKNNSATATHSINRTTLSLNNLRYLSGGGSGGNTGSVTGIEAFEIQQEPGQIKSSCPNFQSSFHNQMRRRFPAIQDGKYKSKRSSKTNLNKKIFGTNSAKPIKSDTSVRIQLNSVSQIDRISRVIFPIAFIAMNLIYWIIYLKAELENDQLTQQSIKAASPIMTN